MSNSRWRFFCGFACRSFLSLPPFPLLASSIPDFRKRNNEKPTDADGFFAFSMFFRRCVSEILFRPGSYRVLALGQLAIGYQLSGLVVDHDPCLVVIFLTLYTLRVGEGLRGLR